MSSYPLPSLANRGQRLAIQADAEHVLVSAGAGTGKTWTLVHRVMRLLHGGVSLPRLAAITFTQKAAAELQGRIAAELVRHPTLRSQRFLLPHAQISTIDSFCARLLREHAVEAGVDPAFSVLASPEDQLIQTEILDDLFHHWYRGRPADSPAEGSWDGVPQKGSTPHREFLRLLELCGFRGGRELLRDELAELMRTARVQGDPDGYVESLRAGLTQAPPPYFAAYGAQLIANYRELTRRIADTIALGERIAPDFNYDKMNQLLAALRAAPSPWDPSSTDPPAPNSDLIEALDLLRQHLERCGVLSPDERWSLRVPRIATRNVPETRHAYDRAKTLVNDKSSPWQILPIRAASLVSDYAGVRPTLETVLELLRQFMLRYARYKAERGWLDFSDLEIKTLEMLRRAPTPLLQRYEALLVDEAQDLNRLQAGIISSLRPARGRYLVGDVKQCIYQFRKAEPSIFKELFHDAAQLEQDEDLQRHAAQPRVRVLLAENFRSQAPILEFVNLIFRELLSPALIGTPYEQQALYPPRPRADDPVSQARPAAAETPPLRHAAAETPPLSDPASDASIAVHLLVAQKGAAVTGQSKLAAEARFIAQQIRGLIRDEVLVRTEGDGLRPVRYGDIAILLRSPKSKGLSVAEGLRAEGIPVAHAGQALFEREEIRDLLNLLKMLGNTQDDIRLAATLCGPVGGFAHDDLVLLRLMWPDSLNLIASLRATLRTTLRAGPAAGAADARAGAGEPARDADPESGALHSPALLASVAGVELRTRIREFLERLDRWRAAVETQDLPAAILTILEESGFLTAQLAAPDGRERMANLELVMGKIRQYAAERGHGLTPMLQHLDDLVDSASDLYAFDERSAHENAVQILSLHKSKGLEFPVVILAHLGDHFVEQDLRGALLSGDAWLGIDHFDPRTLVKTPTLARESLRILRRQQSREEEMRILYVALTRARDHLILTGCSRQWEALHEKLVFWRPGIAPSQVDLSRMSCPLDWILAVFSRHGYLEELDQPGTVNTPRPWLHIQHHSLTDAAQPDEGRPVPPELEALDAILSGAWLEAADETEMRLRAAFEQQESKARARSEQVLALCRAKAPDLLRRTQATYAHAAATTWRSKYWVTEIKRLIDEAIHEEERGAGSTRLAALASTPGDGSPAPPPGGPRIAPPAATRAGTGGGAFSPAREGTYLHAVLAEIDWAVDAGGKPAGDRIDGGGARQIGLGEAATTGPLAEYERRVLPAAVRLAARGEIAPDWISEENLRPVTRSLASELGRQMQAHADRLEREISFSLRATPADLVAVWPQAAELPDDEWLLIQGQIDACWTTDSGKTILVDFKSDRVTTDEQIVARTESYRAQMQLYRLALVQVWNATSTEGWLYYLRPARAVRLF